MDHNQMEKPQCMHCFEIAMILIPSYQKQETFFPPEIFWKLANVGLDVSRCHGRVATVTPVYAKRGG